MIYLIGGVGTGKSSVTRLLFDGLPQRLHRAPNTLTYTSYGDGRAIQLGSAEGTFSGTDTLRWDAQTLAIPFIRNLPTDIFVFGEGARLANDNFFQAVRSTGRPLTVVYLHCQPHIAWNRIQERGHPFKPSYVKGVTTRMERLVGRWGSPDFIYDTSIMTPDQVADDLLSKFPFIPLAALRRQYHET
jgi:hypothetical protein